jgi:hypothetical protein
LSEPPGRHDQRDSRNDHRLRGRALLQAARIGLITHFEPPGRPVGTVNALDGRVTNLCEKVPLSIDTIVSEWKRLTRRAPWTHLSESDWVDHLPPLLTAMIDGVVCGSGSHQARRRVVEQGILHGAHRRLAGLTIDDLYEETTHLRTATWHLLTAETSDEVGAEAFIEVIRFDAAIGVATLASFTGFRRSASGEEQDWAAVIDRLLERWEHASLVEASAQLAKASERHA